MHCDKELVTGELGVDNESQLTFCVSTARFNCAKSSVFPIVPRKMGLNWFMPAFVNNKVGSL